MHATNKNFPSQKNQKTSFNFLVKLTNQTGIIQHTKFGLPDRKNGYSLDDNARALLVVLDWYQLFKDKKALELAGVYLAWLFHARTDENYFYNFSTFDNQFKSILSEDGFGRAFWALGYASSMKSRSDITSTAKSLISEIKHNLNNLNSPRAIAYAILGLCFLTKAEPKNQEWKVMLTTLAEKLVDYYDRTKTKDWRWFEEIIAYSNHLLPLSLFSVYQVTKNKIFLKVATDSLEFLEERSWLQDCPSPIGNHGWLLAGGERATYDQQPIEASEALLAHLSAFAATGDPAYRQKAMDWFGWYHGNNIKGASLINRQTGGCYDSLTAQGVNENQGAESIIAYLMSVLAVLNLEKNEKKKVVAENLILS